jgi:DNA-binding response OmpR family regulator
MKHVLLIEPDRSLSGVYRAYLESKGYSVATAMHAQDAVTQAEVQRPDIIILELQLIQHNGIEFLYEFRSYTEWQAIPVLILTMVPPHSLQLTPDMFEMFGVARCLYKPATKLYQLSGTISEVLDKQPAVV